MTTSTALLHGLATALIFVHASAADSGTDAHPATGAETATGVTTASGTAAAVPTAADEVVAGSNAFAVDVLGQFAARPGNLVISPASLSVALAMAAAGAQGATFDEMAGVCHFPARDRLSTGWHDVLAKEGEIPAGFKDQPAYTLSFVDRCVIQDGMSLLPAFSDAIAQGFSSTVMRADFRNHGDDAVAAINTWAAGQSQGHIKAILSPTLCPPDTRLLLVNALYFASAWRQKFDVAQTADAPFHRAGQADLTVPTMHTGGHLGYAATADAQVVGLEYYGGPGIPGLMMELIVPKAVDGLEKLLADGKALAAAIDAPRDYGIRVDLALPRFAGKAITSLTMTDTLKAMGMHQAFSDGADFTGIAGPHIPLEINAVAHAGWCRWDEHGTEASAITVVVVRYGGSSNRGVPIPPVPVVADRPFLALIRDPRNGLILFAVKVDDPTG